MFPENNSFRSLLVERRKKDKIYSRNSLLLGQPLREVKVCICECVCVCTYVGKSVCACVGGCLSGCVCLSLCVSYYREEW